MNEEELKEELFDAFYWYYRREYGTVVDLIEKENKNKIEKTKNADIYINNKIRDIIKCLKSKEWRYK